ncbi:MAG: AAA family ATPase [Candidatus Cloacimonetes bacterium]|nr:AAA family ATPase [Candidatus Cloacimonadota bacterium]MDD4814778.1 AAA family ATPase [Candidatus Cloacimonadota bacterium]
MIKYRFPFMAIIGQDDLSLALILNLVNPRIGGVLIRGTKGTGKSTAVYGLPQIAPLIKVHESCSYNCSPEELDRWCPQCKSQQTNTIVEREVEVVNLPMNISEENLSGRIDVDRLLKTGDKMFTPGLLAKAHRQILYIDEVNLIPDHITDSLLDVVASGVSTVEREGFSVEHDARFLLIGTMNSEEGELRPQILDRFPLSVTINTLRNPHDRLEIIRRNYAFEADPASFMESFKDVNDMMKQTILAAREMLQEIKIPESLVKNVVDFCVHYVVDGHRPEIVIIKTAIAYAALELKPEVESKHIKMAMKLALLHRTRDGGLKKAVNASDIDSWFDGIKKDREPDRTFSMDYDVQNLSILKGGYLSPSKKSGKVSQN